ncbi:MAG: hypothetical protein M3Z06_03205, partial [Actinomycetota bacterium]|nr:hypothetical protein [Actinomycetota bacterium]
MASIWPPRRDRRWADAIIGATSAELKAGPLALMESLYAVLDQYDTIRPYYRAFIEALARSARSPELRRQLATHY